MCLLKIKSAPKIVASVMDTAVQKESNHYWDVLIVGAGPAGASAAINLARQGWRVLIIDKQSRISTKFGESLPPAAVGIVEQLLGPIADIELAGKGMAKTAGNLSCWQSPVPDISDFFYTPSGFGLCINRAVFDQCLIESAQNSGAQLKLATRFISSQRCKKNEQIYWQVTVQGNQGTDCYKAKYIIDGSGRKAVVAKSLGIGRQYQDQLFAYGQYFVTEEQDEDRFTRLEADKNGWWYSNRLPLSASDGEDDIKAGNSTDNGCTTRKSHRVVVFHSDRDLDRAKEVSTPEGFAELLSENQHINALLKKYSYQPAGKIHGASAASERLNDFAGEGWLAVGDAAQAYDPLSSQGITKALNSGSVAGHVVHYALQNEIADSDKDSGNEPAVQTLFEQYKQDQQKNWETYLQQHHYYYQSQPRWSDQPFWNRRRQDARGMQQTS